MIVFMKNTPIIMMQGLFAKNKLLCGQMDIVIIAILTIALTVKLIGLAAILANKDTMT